MDELRTRRWTGAVILGGRGRYVQTLGGVGDPPNDGFRSGVGYQRPSARVRCMVRPSGDDGAGISSGGVRQPGRIRSRLSMGRRSALTAVRQFRLAELGRDA